MRLYRKARSQRRGAAWGGRPRPPTLFADVLTAKNPILIRGQDECSTTLSFRIRFSGEESAPSICHSESASAVRNLLHRFAIPNPLPFTLSFRIRFSGEESALPASRFRDTRRCPVSRHSVRRRIPALIETDSYQGTPSGVPPTTHPAGPRPSGATATARSFTLPSHQSPAAHESWVCSRRVVFGWVDSGELKQCFYIAPVALQSAGNCARCFLQFALFGGGGKGRGRHIGSGRFRLRLRKRCHSQDSFAGEGVRAT